MSQDLLGVQFCISLVIGMTGLTDAKMRCKTVNFFGGQKLKVCFYLRYLYFNRLIGYVDLLDFHQNWPECLSDTNAQKCVRL